MDVWRCRQGTQAVHVTSSFLGCVHTGLGTCLPLRFSRKKKNSSSWLRILNFTLPFNFGCGVRRICRCSSTSMRLTRASSGGGNAGENLIRGVIFNLDGVLCNNEALCRDAAVTMFSELGVSVNPEDFVPFMATGEANFLGEVANIYGVNNFDLLAAKLRFFEIYIEKYAKPSSGLAGVLDLAQECKNTGLKLAIASSADRIEVNANLTAAGLPQDMFEAVVSAGTIYNFNPAHDILLASCKALGIPPNQCVVISDSAAGVQAARASGMRCIAVMTSLDEDQLTQAGPTLVKPDISQIELSDILTLEAVKMENEVSSSRLFDAIKFNLDEELPLPYGFLSTRRDVLKIGTLVVGFCSVAFALSHWKAFSYASPRAVLNSLFGTHWLPISRSSELTNAERVRQLMEYIGDLEKQRSSLSVPEFPSNLEWLNTTPLRLNKDLKGKVVLLDFWTYCCINCMHVLPDLLYLERKYKNQPFTVIGVHSAKFDNEKDLNAIRSAVLRYNVTHPVVNDGDMDLWRKLGISSWPTLVLLSPGGKLIAMMAGEGHRQDLDQLVEAALQYYGGRKELDNTPIPESLERDKDLPLITSSLKFPGKLASDLANQRLFISDSNHHRIVVTDLDGKFILQVGGGGGEGLRDGSFEYCAFNRPQGVVYNPRLNALYVADTENHAIRVVDFVNEEVRTLAGNGEKGADYKGGRQGTLQALNSPWDVALDTSKGVLYIAMAGQHQIWQLDLSDSIVKVLSGDGFERNLNGTRGSNTSFAQPSGLSLGPGREIFIADSESSSIRTINLQTGGSKLLAGGDPSFPENLFQFGDTDGYTSSAQFQHPLGVLYGGDGLIYIADSYNHKIKVLDRESQMVKTIAGTGKAGFQDGIGKSAQLSEPSGLAQGLDGKLYVADTNNNLIRVLHTREKTLETLDLQSVQPPLQAPQSLPRRLSRRVTLDNEIIKVNRVLATEGDLLLHVILPSGYHFSEEAKSSYEADFEPEAGIVLDTFNGNIGSDGNATLHFSQNIVPTTTTLRITCKVYYCQRDAVCLYKSFMFEILISASKSDDKQDVTISYLVEPPPTRKFAFP